MVGMRGTAARKMNVIMTGEGTATVVFGNGFGTGRQVWDPLRRAFRERWRFLQFDHVGLSPATLTAYSPKVYATLDRYADDLLALLDEYDIRDCGYVGHSVGGMIGCIAATKAPERFGALVLIGASPHYLRHDDYDGGFTRTDLDNLFEAMTRDYAGWAGGFSQLVVGNPEVPSLAQQFSSFLATLPPEVAISTLRTVFASDYRSLLPKVAQPTLVIQATADIAVPESVGRYIADHVRNGTFALVEYTGHLPHLVAPVAMARRAEDFFKRVGLGE